MILSYLVTLLNLYPAANAATQTGSICQGIIEKHSASLFISKTRPPSTLLTIEDREIPRVGNSCRYEYRNYRCPHRINGVDFEITPTLRSSGVLKAIVVMTSNSGSQLFELGDCEPAL